MKIRNGFVSNSSSSSYIIDGEKYTCVDVVKMALDTLSCEDMGEDFDIPSMLEKIDQLEDKNVSFFIEMCDDLEIHKKDDKIYVDATHHVVWDFPAIGYGEEGEFGDDFKETKAYFPQYDLFGKLASYNNPRYPGKWLYKCEHCDTLYFEMDNGIVYCPICKTDPFGLKIPGLWREEKLKRLLK